MRYLAIALALLAGCSSYEPKPLDPCAILEELRALKVEMPEGGLGPEQAVAIALVFNHDLRAARREQQIGEGSVVAAGAATNPELRLGLANLLALPLGFATGFRFFPGVPGESDAKERLAQAKLDAVIARLADREARLGAEVRTAHARILMLDELTRLVDASLRLHDLQSDAMRDRIEQAVSTQLEGLVAGLRRRELEGERESLAAERAEGVADLNGLLGLSPDTLITLRPGADPAVPTGGLAQLEVEALESRADLRAMKQDYEQSEQSLRLEHLKDVPWPRFLQAGVDGAPTQTGGEMSSGLPIPIFSSNEGGLSAAQARREQSRERFTARLHAVRGELHRALLAVRDGDRRRRHFEDIMVPAMADLEKLAQVSVNDGVIDTIRWATLQERTFDLRRQGARARFEWRRAIIQLELATGRP